ncbi:MAG: DUF1461 domain-containing protein [Clostridia bacterium]|nr:DUF1461 domain-containing protein [Clostridia bacterium]
MLKRILYFFLGLIGFLSLLCSIAASSVTNESLMKQGFLQYAETSEMNVPASRYEAYAHAIAEYLNGKGETPRVKDAETGEWTDAFSEKENLHLRDVKGLVNLLKAVRWIGGGLVIAVIGALYMLKKQERPRMLSNAVRGFALAALFLFVFFTALSVWGAVDFDGLFVTFHKAAFANDLWLLNPHADLLLALMPVPFFIWYAKQALLSMLPVLGLMLLVVFAFIRNSTQKEANAK